MAILKMSENFEVKVKRSRKSRVLWRIGRVTFIIETGIL